jgi:hypothetical protein
MRLLTCRRPSLKQCRMTVHSSVSDANTRFLDVQIIHPPAKRKRTKRTIGDEGVLTPGSTTSFPAGLRDNRTSPPTTDEFRPLFPSSPIPRAGSVAPRPSRSVIEIEDTPFETSENPSAEGYLPTSSPSELTSRCRNLRVIGCPRCRDERRR